MSPNSRSTTSKWLKNIAFFLVFAALGGLVGAIIGRSLKHATRKPDDWILLALPVAIFAAIAWHELGHALAGRLAGFRLYLFAAGPLRIDRLGHSLHFSFNRDIRLWGGVAASIPPPDALPSPAQLQRAMLRMVAGGPIFSLLGALVLLPAAWLLQPLSINAAGLLAITGFLSFAIALATCIPSRAAGFLSDGARILQLLRKGPEAAQWCSLAALSSLSTTLRPRDWPPALIDEIAAIPPCSYDGLMALWIRHNHHADREQWDLARTLLHQALDLLDHWPASTRGLLHLSAAFLFATRDRDPAAARHHFTLAAKPGLLSRDDLAPIEAAVLAAEGRRDEALAAADRAETALASKPPGPAAPAREFLQTLRQSA